MADLVAITKPDRGIVRPLEIISSHPMATCVQFGEVLLNDHLGVQKIRNKNKEPEEFIQVVLSKWVSSVDPPPTWPALLDSMKKANMQGDSIENIRAAVLSCKVTI